MFLPIMSRALSLPDRALQGTVKLVQAGGRLPTFGNPDAQRALAGVGGHAPGPRRT